MRAVVEREVTPEEAVKAYHGTLQKQKIKPARPLADDTLTEEPLKLAPRSRGRGTSRIDVGL